MCPLKTFKIRKFKEIWINDNILEIIKDKDSTLRKAKRNKSREDWIIARRLRNACVSIIRKAKNDYIKNELTENVADSKKFWKHIKEVIPDGGSGHNKINLIDECTGLMVDDNNTADYSNDFFYKHWSYSSKGHQHSIHGSIKA